MRTYVARKLSLDRGALELLGNLSNTLGEVVSSSTLLDEPHLFSRKHQPSKEIDPDPDRGGDLYEVKWRLSVDEYKGKCRQRWERTAA